MKPASPALVTYLAALRGQNDAALLMADCFTFTLQSGLVLTYTNVDVAVTLGGAVFAANSVLVDGLRYRSSVGLDVDQQQITLSAAADVTLNGAPFLVALRDGAFDGALIARDRAFFSDRLGGTIIGSVNLFTGRLATVDEVGRTSAKITVQSDLILLDVSMPRNLYQPTCLHTLYDSGCGLVRNTFAANGTIGASSTQSTINWSGAIAGHAQGRIIFTSGANADVSATVSSVVPGTSLQLRYPMPNAPATGDAFTIYQGCDHTMATCQSQFNTLARFRGFPFVPPPEVAF
jgi:uncharacterized phage protein (TIGR02218 family)